MRETTKEERLGGMAIEKLLRSDVVRVDFKRHGKPEINVGKEHPVRPAIVRLFPRSVAMCQDAWSGLGGTRRVSLPWAGRWSQGRRKRSLPYLQARLHPLEG